VYAAFYRIESILTKNSTLSTEKTSSCRETPFKTGPSQPLVAGCWLTAFPIPTYRAAAIRDMAAIVAANVATFVIGLCI